MEAHARLNKHKYLDFIGTLCKTGLSADLPLLENGTMIICNNPYWHFVVDTLGCLPLKGDDPLFYSNQITLDQVKFLDAVFRYFGTNPKFVFYDAYSDKIFKLHNVRIPRVSSYGLNGAFAKARELGYRVLYTQKMPSIAEAYDLIYVSRGNSARRRLLNETELITAIRSKFKLKVVYPESLDVVSQVRLFSMVRYVIGLHGSGLTNVLFAHRLRGLIEIFHTSVEPHFPLLSRFLGCRHLLVKAERVKGHFSSGTHRVRSIDDDCIVDCAKVLRAIEAVLS